MQLTKNFNDSEFQCHCGNCHKVDINQGLADVLQDVRDRFGVSVLVTSGYRCPEHNMLIGGKKYSKHPLATDEDIQIKDIDTRDVFDYINDKHPDTFGLGLYNTFVHVDIRRDKARWGEL